MILEGVVGFKFNADGSITPFAQFKDGSLTVTPAHGPYFEPAYRQRLFTLHSGAVTIAAANVSPVAATTGQLVCGVWNPPNSQKVLSMVRAIVATVSGTPGGPFLWNFNVNQNITAAETGVLFSNYLNQVVKGPTSARALNNVALAGMATAATELRTLGGPAAVAAGAGIYSVVEDTGGDLILPPGTLAGLAALAVGTAHVIRGSVTLEEMPL